jgi:hypothetical protein
LHAVAAIHTKFPLIVFPDDAEADYPVSFSQALEYARLFVIRSRLNKRDDVRRHLGYGLLKFGFTTIPAGNTCHESLK